MISPYDVLGVPSDADEATIRAAFRTAAKAYHPDLNTGDEAAEQRFKQIAAARDAIVKERALQIEVGWHLARVDTGIDEQGDDLGDDAAPNSRRWSRGTFAGVACAVVIACLISAGVVLVSPRAAWTALTPGADIWTGRRTALDTKLAPGPPSETARSHPVTIRISAATAGDARDAASTIGPVTEAGTAPTWHRGDGTWWAFVSDYRVVASTWPGDGSATRQALAKSRTSKTGRATAPTATSHRTDGRATAVAAARRSDTPESPVPVPPLRPTFARQGCWTDEGYGRWLPCGADSVGP